MTTIFVSYRRADTGGYAGRLADSLEACFGKGNVFQDIETIAPGSNFVHSIDAAIARCQVFVVLIGNTWLTERSADGSPRLDNPQDFVRQEVAAGLRAKRPVIPVLVEGSAMPKESQLPDDLKPLAWLQAMELSDSRWDYDIERLAKVMRKLVGGDPSRRRAFMVGGIAVLLAAAAGSAAYVAFRQPTEVFGRWRLPNGSFWIVLQEGDRLSIEETHYESKEVWLRGAGSLNGNRVEFFLETVYAPPRRFEGTLTLSADGRTLSGVVQDTSSGTKSMVALTRRR